MNSSPNHPPPESPTRGEQIDRAAEEITARRMGGETISDSQVAQMYSSLMPQLGDQLRRLERLAHDLSRSPLKAHAAAETAVPSAGCFDDSTAPRQRIDGYDLLREISRGGQAVVFEAIQKSTGRRVAIKFLHGGAFSTTAETARFEREVRILGALDHPNIVSVLDRGKTSDGALFLVMEFIRGQRLDEFLFSNSTNKTTPERSAGDILRLFMTVCDAVNIAHLRGVVHRDLKPSNILVDERGEPHVVDFGLARAGLDRWDTSDGTHRVSVTGQFLGSLPWASPEQAEGQTDRIDLRTDVYSLGVILYQMVTGGKFPYEVVGNMRDVLNNILTAEPTPPSKIISVEVAKKAQGWRKLRRGAELAVNEVVEGIVLKALAKKPEKRYQTAGELARDIGAYLSGLPTSARVPQVGHRILRRFTIMPPSARRTVILAAIACVGTAAVCGITYLIRYQSALRETEQGNGYSEASQKAVVQLDAGSRLATYATLAGSGTTKQAIDSPIKLPFNDTARVTDGPTDAPGSLSETHFRLSTMQFHISFDHMRSGKRSSNAQSAGTINFTPRADADFSLESVYAVTNGPSRHSISLNQQNEVIFKRDQASKDIKISGKLIAGKQYNLTYDLATWTADAGDTGATGLGQLILRFESASKAAWGNGRE